MDEVGGRIDRKEVEFIDGPTFGDMIGNKLELMIDEVERGVGEQLETKYEREV